MELFGFCNEKAIGCTMNIKDYKKIIEVTEEDLNQLLIGGNHLASALINWLGADEEVFPSYKIPIDEALKIIKDPNQQDVWICWKKIMLFRDKYRNY